MVRLIISGPLDELIYLPAATVLNGGEVTEMAGGAILHLAPGTTIEIRRPRQTGLLEFVFYPASTIGSNEQRQSYLEAETITILHSGARIAIARELAATMNPLELDGVVTVGDIASSVNPDYLQRGDFVFTERLLYSSTGRGGVETRTGQLRSGSRVRIVDMQGIGLSSAVLLEVDQASTDLGDHHPLLRAFITTGGRPASPILETSNRSQLSTVLVEPRWTDRALSSPLVLAITTTVVLILSLWQFVSLIIKAFAPKIS